MFRERIQKAVMSIIGIVCCLGYALLPLIVVCQEVITTTPKVGEQPDISSFIDVSIIEPVVDDIINTNDVISNPTIEVEETSEKQKLSKSIEQEKPNIQQAKLESEVNEPSSEGAQYTVPNKSKTVFKATERYQMLGIGTPERRLVESGWVDEHHLCRIGDYYCVAMGYYYTDGTIGRVFKITFEDNTTIEVIVCDNKQKAHTDDTWRYTVRDNYGNPATENVLEFMTDYMQLPAGWSPNNWFNSAIIKIERIK